MTFFQESLAVDATTVSSSRNVRFALRKKRTLSDRSKKEATPVTLSSYNSDFLSGLFADVAKANVLKELSIELPSSSCDSSCSLERSCPTSMFDSASSSHIVPESASDSRRPLKKSRVSFRASSYRSRASCMNLLAVQSQSNSSRKLSMASRVEKKSDSLSYQLNCLGQDSEPSTTKALATSAIASVSPTNKGKKIMKDVAALAFPNLPSTVSDSSCESSNVTATGLTRERCLVQHGPAPEMAASACSKDSFGWFVDLDDNEAYADDFAPSVTTEKTVAADLAFQAPTAPKRPANNVQEEMEQAYAADTIDSVLGDLF